MAKKRDVIIGVIIIVSFLFISLLTLVALLGVSDEGMFSFSGLGDRVAIVDVHGTISNSSEVVRQLRKYAEDGSVPAVVIHINSPGGGAASSQEIFEEIYKLRESGKKVVASMGTVAASGGYYVAAAADTIVANPATLTGSIGVILQFPVAEELLKKIGVSYEVVKSGEIKDVGSFSRAMTEKERKSLQSVVDDSYDQFVEAIVRGRNMPREEVLKIANGSLFTGNQAKELGLVDELGNLYDAIKIAGEMVGIKEYPKTVKEDQKKISWFNILTRKVCGLLELDGSEQMMPKLEYILK